MTPAPRLLPWRRLAALASLAAAAAWARAQPASSAPPLTWIDPDTGHRIRRLTTEPGTDSFYFNINPYTPDGREMAFTTAEGNIGVVDLATFQTRIVVRGMSRAVVMGRKTPTIYYLRKTDDPLYSTLWATNVDTGATREIGRMPRRATVASINADETLGAGTFIEGDATGPGVYGGMTGSAGRMGKLNLGEPENKSDMMEERLRSRLPMSIFTVDLQTGRIRIVMQHSTDWLDHIQFSPTDPTLIMYAHQGAWQEVDKLWVIRTDGTGNRNVDSRIMINEAHGHQWWDDADNIWYDLHFPAASPVNYIASVNVRTGAQTWYYYRPEQASIHFNRSADGKLFCGDGGREPDGQWIYLFRPVLYRDQHTLGINLIRPGYFKAERLVNMSKHQYRLEPNVSFTPDGRYVVFRSNMFGPDYAFAVEVAKASSN